jgi:hypothetical protein
MRFDCFPFIVERSKAEKKHILIIGIEVDRGTERVKSYDNYRAYIRTKVVEDIALLESGVIRERFGLPAGHIIYVNPSQTRLKNIMAVVEEETARKPSLRKYFLFTTHKASTDNPIPTGDMLTKDYQRVGYEPFNLLA